MGTTISIEKNNDPIYACCNRGTRIRFLGVCSPGSVDFRPPTGTLFFAMSNVGEIFIHWIWIKRPCECTIAHDISLENVSRMHELSEAFHAISLRHTCLLSILEQFSKLSSRAGMDTLKRHLPISGPEGLNELRKIVERFEEKIYSTATSQMLTMETKSFNATTNSLPSNSAGHNKKSPNDKKSPARKKALRSS
ncbi:hypothetical protein VitviT2T_002611 [Vitis vinifera]|uniref:Mediator complex subunit 15 KIX domain-containing protein n=1 Tax=Vitis vinifera TaxID=29760 RepID=A0ABY9BJ09_VITVI|nr:hypothetical protein VitviT2T_002611 [Vitis vinifera]